MKFDSLYESLLLELFDSQASTETKWKSNDDIFALKHSTTFEASNGRTYVLYAAHYPLEEILNEEEIDALPDGIQYLMGSVFIENYEITFEDKGIKKKSEKIGITNVGGAAEVFGKVINLIRAFLKKNKVKLLYFAAKEPSRIKLYERLTKTLAPEGRFKTFITKGNKNETIFICYK